MIKYWIIVAKRPGGDIETIRQVIDSKVWDFVSSRDSLTPVTPSYALQLRRNDKVLFYISDRDQNGYPLYHYKAFIAHAVLDSAFEKEGEINGELIENFVRLKDVKHFRSPTRIDQVCKNFKICGGPKTIVPIKKEKYDKIMQP